MRSSSDEDESESIKYLKRNPDLSLGSWDGICFYNTERTLNNACIRAENFYKGNKKMHIHKQRSNIYKLAKFKQYNLAHLKYLQSMKIPRLITAQMKNPKLLEMNILFQKMMKIC
jgi:hypothetical protein